MRVFNICSEMRSNSKLCFAFVVDKFFSFDSQAQLVVTLSRSLEMSSDYNLDRPARSLQFVDFVLFKILSLQHNYFVSHH